MSFAKSSPNRRRPADRINFHLRSRVRSNMVPLSRLQPEANHVDGNCHQQQRDNLRNRP